MSEAYDVVIIGAGQAGIPLAWDLAEAGQRVALVERKHMGGSCVNFGCTPTKAAIASAKLAYQARRASEYGLKVPTVEVDFPAVIARAKAMATGSRDHLHQAFDGAENPRLLEGHARLDGCEGEFFRVSVNGRRVRSRHVVLNTGTRSFSPPIAGLAEAGYLHAGNWLDRPELPRHLAMIGGGYIGLEMAQFYRRMGSEVTVVERSERIIGREDADVTEMLEGLLAAEGIHFRLGVGIERIEAAATGLVVKLDQGAPLAVSHVFVATARTPNTDDLGLETIGLKPGDHGFLRVDERLATDVAGVWAAGDIRGGPQFTHTAWDDYRVLASQLAGDRQRTTERIVPYALFTDPELGRVGLSEAEARMAGKQVLVGKFPMRENGKAKELGETAGFIKVVADADSHEILGAAVLATEGGELVHLYVDLMNAGARYDVLVNAIHIHPTLAEAVQSAAAAIGSAT